MKKKIVIILSYIILFTNSNLFAAENSKILKVGLLAPLSGKYAELGNSFLYSLQLALEEINDENIFILPRDSGFNNKEKLRSALKDMKSQGIKVVIGPMSNSDFNEVAIIDKNGKSEKIKKASKKFIASLIVKKILDKFLSHEKSLN